MENTIFAILLSGILLNNCTLQSYLGITTLLGYSESTKKAAVMGGAVTLVTTLSAAAAWAVSHFVLAPFGLEYLQTLVFVTIILAVSYLAGAAAKSSAQKALGVWFPLIVLNSAVLGVAVNNAAAGYSFLEAVVSALASGLGFLLAVVVFSGVCTRIENQYVPRAFRGLPVQLMAACIIALALYAF
jgi:electron transport complex protein RnfA